MRIFGLERRATQRDLTRGEGFRRPKPWAAASPKICIAFMCASRTYDTRVFLPSHELVVARVDESLCVV